MRITTIILIAIIIGVGFAALQILGALAPEPPNPQNREPVIAVSVIDANTAFYRPYVSVIGTIEAKDSVVLTSPLQTEVIEVLVQEGSQVTKGTPLVKLDTRETRYQLEARMASLDDVVAQIESLKLDVASEQHRLSEIRKLGTLAGDELNRNKQLFERGVVAEAAVDQASVAMSARELEVIGQLQKINSLDLMSKRLQASSRMARAEIKQLRLVLERATISAPFDGIITTIHASAGGRATRESPLIELYDPSTIRLRAAIPNTYASKEYLASLEGRIRTSAGQTSLNLNNISPEAKPGRGTVDALFSLAEGDWLLGATVEFDLLLPSINSAIAVPFDALYASSRIYIVDAEQRAQPVECTSYGQTLVAEVSQALLRCPDLSNGDKVIVNRIPNLISGTKLQILPS